MRNLTFLSVLGLAVVFVLAFLPKIANAGGTPGPNECRGAATISCSGDDDDIDVDDDDIEIWATYRAVDVDDDDIRLLRPGSSAPCNANNITFNVKATDPQGGVETANPNPCDSCGVKVPLADVAVDDDDCTFHNDDDDYVECHVNCELSLNDNCDPYMGGDAVGVSVHSKGQINPAKGKGVNNGNDKVETSAFCGEADLVDGL